MAQRQQQVSDIIMKDPAVESLTAYVGVDGTNPSLNSARLQINLKPLDERDDRVNAVIERLQNAVARVPGVELYLQPIQDLTIDTGSAARSTSSRCRPPRWMPSAPGYRSW